jgi:thymidine kinase
MKKATKIHSLQEIDDKIADYDVIAIDEGQFFSDVSVTQSDRRVRLQVG